MGRVSSKGGKKHHSNAKGKLRKTRRREKDYDQVWEEALPENTEKALQEATQYDEDKPGLGQYYCIPCARYFISKDMLVLHNSTKPHKRKAKQLKEEKPWTVEDSILKKIDNGKRTSQSNNNNNDDMADADTTNTTNNLLLGNTPRKEPQKVLLSTNTNTATSGNAAADLLNSLSF